MSQPRSIASLSSPVNRITREGVTRLSANGEDPPHQGHAYWDDERSWPGYGRISRADRRVHEHSAFGPFVGYPTNYTVCLLSLSKRSLID